MDEFLKLDSLYGNGELKETIMTWFQYKARMTWLLVAVVCFESGGLY